MKRSLLVWQILAIFCLHHVHARKDTRLSPLFRTASNGKVGGPGNEAKAKEQIGMCICVNVCVTHLQYLLTMGDTVSSILPV